ncbi:hypothetical protein HRW23_17730 [Streptomyces lunaelactis]|uniref:hypothetical protein n=1 Tax=Streptomyces lunaelactis TaxID=1535768 RepID=UPI0015855D86|nr:hypothetical protein [Streptomyces lunaelactis]NUK03744.1 hypothetical protein [Streptomyces lunaelactis]NUK11494.1 hypothetical protein [Streptomyces lunaelactis]NUK18187.1 hypothetical protein [Streptomyces lunaelactis]NUK25462.1 hypothetical protein [Streptomyces lunaelactis]NUK36685.1 hypothetical protein [Streptomyces lunaelactis]
MGGSPLNHIARTARPMALLSAAATLLGALFICVSPPSPHHNASPDIRTAYTCPYDNGACGLLPLVEAAVLTAPPHDAPLEAGALPSQLDPSASAGRPARSGAQPRAPDLHVLQVLRT